MPVYEYYCPTCSTKFEKLRPMSAADEPVSCSAGHPKSQRLISIFAKPARGGAALEELPMAGGGCACGGACSCGH